MENKRLGNFCMIGYPDDLGVKNVNGRLGAALGPQAFLDCFQKMNGRVPLKEHLLSPYSVPMVMVPMGEDLNVNYVGSMQTTNVIFSKEKTTLIAVGGGHDYAYPWFRGALEARSRIGKKRLGCLNIDAHFDLRHYEPVMTSGSPFRRLIEEKWISPKNLVEFGIQSHCNGPELWQYAKEKKIKVVPFEKLRNGKAVLEFKKALRELSKKCDEVLLSVDLDAMSLAFCPGVSAPQGEGFTGSELYQMMEIAGADKKVTSLGWFELSPPLDFQNMTARVAAQATWHFLSERFSG